ncbi:MAG: spore maturation protein [Agathobaculum sp.]|jgi:spore maturation protein B|uniref:spore maturation protein n=1 Tax=Agathobaculum sp. TaxID=2048138 RepID=UPI003D902545
MQWIQDAFVPALLAIVGIYALYKGVDVFSVFLRGAKNGLQTAVNILPTMVGMLTVVHMLRASGAIDFVAAALAPAFRIVGIPKECAALVLLGPVSGGGKLAMGSELMHRFGPDSYIGRVAAVMLGASETSLYTLSVYSGYLGLHNLRYAVIAALCADLAAFTASAMMVRLLF